MVKTDEETNKKKPQFPDDSAKRKPAGDETCRPPSPRRPLRGPHLVWKRTPTLRHCSSDV